MAVLSLPAKDGEALLREQSYALSNVLRSARAEAVFSGRSLGLVWSGQRGEFYTLTAEGWLPVQQGVLARGLVMDERLQADIRIAGEGLGKQDNEARRDGDKAEDAQTPQLLFLADGQVSPFEWTLYSEDGKSVQFDQNLQVMF